MALLSLLSQHGGLTHRHQRIAHATDGYHRDADPGQRVGHVAEKQPAGDRGKGDLPDRQGDAAGDDGDDDRAGYAGAAVIGGQAGRQAGNERQRVNGEYEQQPAEEADAEDAEDDPDDDHGGYLRDKGANGRAFHHHHRGAWSACPRMDFVGSWKPALNDLPSDGRRRG